MTRTLAAALAAAALLALPAAAADSLDATLPVRGLCIGAPRPAAIPRFIDFIDNELGPRHVNTLVLRVDYDYQFQSHPELAGKNSLTLAEVKRLVAACRANHIHLIPQINLLGHQSWASSPGSLLRHYPEFDETPWVKNPEHYKWPNPDGLYCRSYCPLHPQVHEVVFALMDELCDAFETDAFHAGMDEVFYLGESKCPRCAGKDKAELFAGEVILLHDHLKEKGRALWIWGDRLLDGRATGLGEWEASYIGTARAVDLIPKDTTICDWHYDRADLTPAYFAIKGLNVISCPWKDAAVGAAQAEDLITWRRRGPPEIKSHLRGVMQTVWSGASEFLDRDYHSDPAKTNAWNCFTATLAQIQSHAQ